MATVEWIGFIGGAVTTLSLLPQVIRVYRLKSTWEISLSFTLLLILGLSGWLTYGVLLGLLPVILWNSLSLLLAFALLYAKLKFRTGRPFSAGGH